MWLLLLASFIMGRLQSSNTTVSNITDITNSTLPLLSEQAVIPVNLTSITAIPFNPRDEVIGFIRLHSTDLEFNMLRGNSMDFHEMEIIDTSLIHDHLIIYHLPLEPLL